MKLKALTIISTFVLVVAGISTSVTSQMIAKGISDNTLYSKVHAILIVLGVLILIALICLASRAIIPLQNYLNESR